MQASLILCRVSGNHNGQSTSGPSRPFLHIGNRIYGPGKCSIRRSEILGLGWTKVDLDEGIIEVKKRLVPVTGAVLNENKTKNKSSRRKIKIS